MGRRRNPNLKKSHETFEITHEQIQELKRCIVDPKYFIRKYIKITHPMHGRIPFELYDYQEDLLDDYEKNQFNIVLSARQTGKTETSAAYLLWYAIFQEHKTILIVSKDSGGAKEIIKKIQDAYESLPNWLKPGIQEDNWNKHTCGFDNNSRIMAETTTETSGRGLSISLLYCDEFAFVKHYIQSEFWNSIYPTLSTGGSCIITSTPNGDTNLFAQLWRGAEAGTNSFEDTRIYWDQPPGRDEEFRRQKIADIGETRWLQEFECEFISSDHALFDTRIVQIEEKRVANVKPAFNMNGEQEFWKPLSDNMSYLVGVDPATGSGNDFTVIEVFEFPSMHQVMEYRANTVSEVVIYAHLKKILGFLEEYSDEVYFSIENNGVGRALIALYMNDERPPMQSHFMSEQGKNKLGYFTTEAAKRTCAIRFKNFFERREIQIYSPALFTEIKNYVRKGDKFEAQTGSTDDCISATFIVLRMLDELSMYDVKAYEKLYRFSSQVSGDEWLSQDNDGPLPAGVL